MKIYIPSSNRADDRLLKGPLRHDRSAELVVPVDQAVKYRRALSARGMESVAVLECPERGIAATRRWIGQLAEKRGEDRFCMMDDDLSFNVRRSTEKWGLQVADKTEYGKMVAWVRESLGWPGVAHSSVSVRQGNDRAGAGGPDTLWVSNVRTLRVLAYRTDVFLRAEHGRVEVMEDFDVNLQLLRAGCGNVVTHWWAQDQRMTGEKGGCSDYRTHAVHEASARRLAELHPGLVHLRQKDNKTGGEFGRRTEVTISWKKAFGADERCREEPTAATATS